MATVTVSSFGESFVFMTLIMSDVHVLEHKAIHLYVTLLKITQFFL